MNLLNPPPSRKYSSHDEGRRSTKTNKRVSIQSSDGRRYLKQSRHESDLVIISQFCYYESSKNTKMTKIVKQHYKSIMIRTTTRSKSQLRFVVPIKFTPRLPGRVRYRSAREPDAATTPILARSTRDRQRL